MNEPVEVRGISIRGGISVVIHDHDVSVADSPVVLNEARYDPERRHLEFSGVPLLGDKVAGGTVRFRLTNESSLVRITVRQKSKVAITGYAAIRDPIDIVASDESVASFRGPEHLFEGMGCCATSDSSIHNNKGTVSVHDLFVVATRGSVSGFTATGHCSVNASDSAHVTLKRTVECTVEENVDKTSSCVITAPRAFEDAEA